MRPLSLSSIFAALASLVAGWATVLHGAAATPVWSPQGVQRLLMGSSETLIPVFVTFAFLSVAWLFVAVGMPPGLGIAERFSAARRRLRSADVDAAE